MFSRSDDMMDQLNAELVRFAELCAEVRQEWVVRIYDIDDYPRVNIVGVDEFDLGCCDSDRLTFWLLEKFQVEFSVLPHALGTTVYSNNCLHDEIGTVIGVSESFDLHFASLYVVLKSVNAILEREVQH